MSAHGRKRLTVLTVVAALVGMGGLAASAVPLYRAFCQATGYGGTTQTADAAPTRVLDRTIDIRFDTNVASGAALEFTPVRPMETLHIGETGLAFFHVRNTSDQPVTARATYNVAPHISGQYFVKLECFCFQDRTFAPGESAELPVVFFVDPQLASDPETRGITEVTLSYTYFRSAASAQQEAPLPQAARAS
jgi:cytochrome c oxidase assembly protein subunit 11